MSRLHPVLLCCCAIMGVSSFPTRAADIATEQSALMHDLLASADAGQKLPGKTDPKILEKAMEALRQEKLAGGAGRPVFQESGLLDRYGKAMFLGSRTQEFAADIGKIKDIADSGNRAALKKALGDLWVKAGRARPDQKALEPVINSLYGAKGQEPSETLRHVIDKPDYRVEMTHARAGGLMQVEVVSKDKKGHETDRTVFQGITETAPTPDGRELQRHLKITKACTSTEKTDHDTMGDLEGEWHSTGQSPQWTFKQDGEKVILTEQREKNGPLVYTGTYHLGKIYAEHPITVVTDMEDSLPADVRSQLTTMGLTFRVSLEVCGDDTDHLRGTWSSQHVTYDGMTHTVSKVHDPYDIQFSFSRGGNVQTADGAAKDELL